MLEPHALVAASALFPHTRPQTVDAGTLAFRGYVLVITGIAKVLADTGSLVQRCSVLRWLCISSFAHAHWYMGGVAHAGHLPRDQSSRRLKDQ
jgi:hypothetical protein